MIAHLSPVCRLLTKDRAQILIVNTANGPELAYLPFGGATEETLKQASGQADSASELQSARKLYAVGCQRLGQLLEADSPAIRCDLLLDSCPDQSQLRQLVEQIGSLRAPVAAITLQPAVAPCQVQECLAWLDSLAAVRSDEALWHTTGLRIRPQILCVGGWNNSLPWFLEQLAQHPETEPSILFPQELFLDADALASTPEMGFLKQLEDSGYSFPVRFASVESFYSPRAWDIVHQCLSSNLTGFVELAHTDEGLRQDNDAAVREALGLRYRAFVRAWLSDTKLLPLALIDVRNLWRWLLQGTSHLLRFNWRGALPSPLELERLWQDAQRAAQGLHCSDASLVPAGLWLGESAGQTATDHLLRHFFETCSASLEYLIDQLFHECSLAMEGNRPNWLDLSQQKPAYHARDWQAARAITCLDGGKK